jgi:NADH:ubiquinone reductase (H+-translocating)
MKQLIIVGGGFAGLWAAFSAVRHAKILEKEEEVTITLVNKDQHHGLRPRFYESALENARISLEKFLHPLGVTLRVDEVSNIDHKSQKISFRTAADLSYDKLILASGSQLTVPEIPGLKKHAFNIDTFDAAKKLQEHVGSLSRHNTDGQFTIVVAGGGFTGVEAATDFMDRLIKITPENKEPRVIVIDRTDVASRFSAETQAVILKAFNDMDIETMSNVEIKEVHRDHIKLSNGEKINTQTVVWTAGMQSSGLTKQFGLPLDRFGRLPVDRYLRIQGISNCFAAGDVAAATTDGKHMALLSCQHAMPQGRFAGNNAIADLFNEESLMYEQPKFVTSIDLGSWGALYAEGWDLRIVSIKKPAKEIKLFINHDRIYPPDINEYGIAHLLNAAEPAFKAIKT